MKRNAIKFSDYKLVVPNIKKYAAKMDEFIKELN